MTSSIYTPPLAEYHRFGHDFVAGNFNVADQHYVIVFSEMADESAMRTKGYNIELPGFQYPAAGMVEVMFDAVSDPEGYDFGCFGHITPTQNVSPVTLLKVISLIDHHYNCRQPGGYLFYAATTTRDPNRKTDLLAVYDRMLGITPTKSGSGSKISQMLPSNWQVLNKLSHGGRGYAILC